MIWCGNSNPSSFCEAFFLGIYMPASKKLRCLEFQEYTWIGHLGEWTQENNGRKLVAELDYEPV